MRFTLGIIAVFAASAAGTAAAQSHELINKAVSSYEDADFEHALDVFIEAEGRTDLTTADLLKLFEMRALVYHAMDDEVRMRDDLRRIASVRPTYRLGRLAPPPVRSAFDDVREAIAGGIRIDLVAQSLPGRLRLTAVVRRDVTEIGRALEMSYRVDGGDWKTSVGERAVVSVPKGGKIHYFARLVGAGGATVTTAGSARQPRVADVPGETKPQVIRVAAKRKVPLSATILWSAAGAALVGAAAVGPIALNKDKDLEQNCGATNPPSCSVSERDKVKRFARATDALWISGAALAVTGTILYIVHRKKLKRGESAKPVARKLQIAPWASRRDAGAAAALTF